MTKWAQLSSRDTRTFIMLIAFLLMGTLCASALGHEWTINGKKVKAKAVDFNGSQVLLENDKGKRKAFPINELHENDLQYLTNLLSIRNAEIQQRLEREQLAQQRTQLLAQFVDVWTVRMVAPNGELGMRNYFAANSAHAKQLAWQEFPNVRIAGVQRMRRANEWGVGGTGRNRLINGPILLRN